MLEKLSPGALCGHLSSANALDLEYAIWTEQANFGTESLAGMATARLRAFDVCRKLRILNQKPEDA